MSSLFKINVQTLHYYDHIGLLKPAIRDPETGRRRYEFDQVYKLASILYMRKLGYSLDQIASYMESRSIQVSLEQLEEQSAVLRARTSELMAVDTAIQRKIRFIREELEYLEMGTPLIRQFPRRGYLPIGAEEILYRSESFYFYPTIAFYEGDRKYFGAYLCDGGERQEIPESCETIPEGEYLCGYHFGPYETILTSARALRESVQDRKLGDLLINFNIVDQFIERDSGKYITMMQIPVIR